MEEKVGIQSQGCKSENSETNFNIPDDMTFEEYAYTKHHDGRSYNNFDNASDRNIYNDAMDDAIRNGLQIPTVSTSLNFNIDKKEVA